jgi:3-deoxy-manno-octulosonate cytidylyltransferase (CMP-KDO synthetase)
MTGSHHRSDTERCNEVANQLRSEGEEFDYVINIQGAEPFFAPQQIGQLITGLLDDKPPIATMVKKIDNTADLQNPNVVKVAIDQHGFAMLFSRSPVPYVRDHPPSDWIKITDFFKHLGIYAYKWSILREIVALSPTGLECAESLEQLRWLGNGYPIKTYQTEYENIAIDVPSDLLKITNRF